MYKSSHLALVCLIAVTFIYAKETVADTASPSSLNTSNPPTKTLQENLVTTCGDPNTSDISPLRLEASEIFVDMKSRFCKRTLKVYNCLNPMELFTNLNGFVQTPSEIPFQVLDTARQQCLALLAHAKMSEDEINNFICRFDQVSLSTENSFFTTQCDVDTAVLERLAKLNAEIKEKTRLEVQSAALTAKGLVQVHDEKIRNLTTLRQRLDQARRSWVRCFNSWGWLSRVRLYQFPDHCLNGQPVTLNSDTVNMDNQLIENEIIKHKQIILVCANYIQKCNAPSPLEWINTR